MPPLNSTGRSVPDAALVPKSAIRTFSSLTAASTNSPHQVPEECWHCDSCVLDCPVGAISLRIPCRTASCMSTRPPSPPRRSSHDPVKPVIETDLLIVGGQASAASWRASRRARPDARTSSSWKSAMRAAAVPVRPATITSTAISLPITATTSSPYSRKPCRASCGQLKEPSLMHKFLEKSFELVQMWDAWGVNMRPTGDWECKGHALPGKPRAFLKYDGSDQKKVLVREAKAAGVKFYNHHPVVELARVGDRIAGALAVDISTEQPAFVPVRAKNRPARHRTHAPPVHERVHAGLHVQYGALPQLRGRTGPRLARGRAHGQHGIPLHPCGPQVFAALRQGDVDRRLPLSRRQAHRPLRHQVRSAVRGRDQRHLEFRL